MRFFIEKIGRWGRRADPDDKSVPPRVTFGLLSIIIKLKTWDFKSVLLFKFELIWTSFGIVRGTMRPQAHGAEIPITFIGKFWIIIFHLIKNIGDHKNAHENFQQIAFSKKKHKHAQFWPWPLTYNHPNFDCSNLVPVFIGYVCYLQKN